MSHWYDKNGKLFDTDLRTARKEGYVPSVTEIIHTFENSYGLDLYKARQMFFASLTLPRPEGITDEEYFELVKKDSEEHSERAKQFGTELHGVITDILNDCHWAQTPGNLKIKKAYEVVEWIRQNKDSVIVDFKTQETKDGKFKQPYDSWLFQLCGYYLAHQFCRKQGAEVNFAIDYYGGTIDYFELQGTPIKLINIMISSNEDIPVKIYEWKPDKIQLGIKVFEQMIALYRTLKRLPDCIKST
jgi:hypothetical protein